MSNRVFELAAMKAAAEYAVETVPHMYDQHFFADRMMEEWGVLVIESTSREGTFVMQPHNSTRVHPATALVTTDLNLNSVPENWTYSMVTGGAAYYVYGAGEYKLAGNSKKSKVRTQAEDTALHS